MKKLSIYKNIDDKNHLTNNFPPETNHSYRLNKINIANTKYGTFYIENNKTIKIFKKLKVTFVIK
jgi:hypothetical protein